MDQDFYNEYKRWTDYVLVKIGIIIIFFDMLYIVYISCSTNFNVPIESWLFYQHMKYMGFFNLIYFMPSIMRVRYIREVIFEGESLPPKIEKRLRNQKYFFRGISIFFIVITTYRDVIFFDGSE